MRLPFISMVILMLAAAVAPLPSDAANIKVPKSAATLAMGSVDSGEIHLTNIRVNGQPISQPVAPGSTVQISFDWTISVVPGCPICNIQGYIGFQGTAATCFKSLDHPPPQSGSFSGSLTTPDKAGTQLIMVNETLDNSCQPVTSGGGGLPSIAATVSVVKVK
jgi:hypothetical protein